MMKDKESLFLFVGGQLSKEAAIFLFSLNYDFIKCETI